MACSTWSLTIKSRNDQETILRIIIHICHAFRFPIVGWNSRMEWLTCILIQVEKMRLEVRGTGKFWLAGKINKTIMLSPNILMNQMKKTEKCTFFTFFARWQSLHIYLVGNVQKETRNCLSDLHFTTKVAIFIITFTSWQIWNSIIILIVNITYTEGDLERWTWNLGNETFFAVHWNQTNAKKC